MFATLNCKSLKAPYSKEQDDVVVTAKRLPASSSIPNVRLAITLLPLETLLIVIKFTTQSSAILAARKW